ncbi:hypothetical protein [Streptomyces sp. NPDC006879]|uniref:DUF7144 family membrane protein n=1 Tax=Streptomyces sp. NPDC006879 TaxID=3364767 RepID=UPI003695128A
MTSTPSGAPGGAAPTPGSSGSWAAGGSLFAGALMIIGGFFGVFEGIAGIASDEVYARVGDYTFKFDLTAWGWIHLILGIIVIIVGWGILQGAEWGRVVGIIVASLYVLAHFLWLPYQPFWAIVAIAVGVFVIWALCTESSSRRA